MSKIYKLREWLTVPEAAKQLSISFGEEVTEADVLRLALEKHLRLSVYFVNKATVCIGKYVPWEDTDWRLIHISDKVMLTPRQRGRFEASLVLNTTTKPFIEEKKVEAPRKLEELLKDIAVDEYGEYEPILRSISIDDQDRFISLSEEIQSIEGVWDLPMIGAEQLDVEHRFQKLTGGPGVTLIAMDGAFVERSDGRICQLQEDYDENEYQAGSKAELKILKQHIINKQLSESEADKLLKKHAEDRKEFLDRRNNTPKKDHYYPAGGLPEDAVFVVRRESIRDFEQLVNDDQKEVEKSLSTSERNSLLTIIAALCQQARIKPLERGAPTKIANLTEAIGAPVSDDTVRRLLTKLPDALESRMK